MDGFIIIAMSIALFFGGIKLRSTTKRIAKNGEEVEGIVFDFIDSTNVNSKHRLV